MLSLLLVTVFNQNMGDSAGGLEAAERVGVEAPSLMQLHKVSGIKASLFWEPVSFWPKPL